MQTIPYSSLIDVFIVSTSNFPVVFKKMGTTIKKVTIQTQLKLVNGAK